ncbi:hypothetical protein RBE51_17835 [Pseudomonas taiwanensis]|uniref:hypothetical protein n=1 Tax=Pseudomonas taiwanensis TaxID=470150 RepID=UPI0028DEB187|nr:hypothetical protein [Pseudomonas taiwanensis]MDT8924672.1 hypothetical protein [Pseudomonas taiwanensis]
MDKKNPPRTSRVQCADGVVMNVTISEGRSQVADSPIMVISIQADDLELETWIAEYSCSNAAIAKILYAAKHSPEFRESLKVKDIAYPESDVLQVLLEQLDKPCFIETSGNLDQTPVHEERCTILNFPDGIPINLEKAARKADWLSVRHGGGQHRLRVYAEYGSAHTYNKRLIDFLGCYLTGTLTKSHYPYLGCGRASTVIQTPAIKRVPVAVSPAELEKQITWIIHMPLANAEDALHRLKAGRDAWSTMKEPELRSHVSDPESLRLIQSAFKDIKDRQSAYRWHLRGLPAAYAIHKIHLDAQRGLEYARTSR